MTCCDVRNAAHRLLRGVAGHVGRQRYQRDYEEDGYAPRSARREMVEEKMDVNDI
jgi:hypothetical protein